MTANKTIALSYEQLEKALLSLDQVVKQKDFSNRILIDATIQRFEYSVELYWKTLKRILGSLGIEANSPKDTLIKAYSAKLINNEELWLQMLLDRNQTSHTYQESVADTIYENITTKYTALMLESIKTLTKYKEND